MAPPRRNLPLDLRQRLGRSARSVRPVLDPSAVLSRALPSFSMRDRFQEIIDQAGARAPGGVQPQVEAPTLGHSLPPQTPGPAMQGPQPFGGATSDGQPRQARPEKSNLLDWMLNQFNTSMGPFGSVLEQFRSLPDYTTSLDGMLAEEQRLDELRERALQLNASLATASYDAQLKLIRGEIGRLTEAQGRVDGLWQSWETQAQAAIAQAAQQTQQAYTQYVDLLNQGFDNYEALTQSRYREYQQQVHDLVGQYLSTTNQSYQDFIATLPEAWAPVIDAVNQGDMAAAQAVAQRAEEAQQSIEGQLIEGTTQFAQEMGRIRADNPALADELLGTMRSATDVARIEAATAGEGAGAIERAASEVARTAAQAALASQMRQNEQERVSLVNEAARTRHQLLTASGQELDRLLEESQYSREQALVQVQADLDNRLRDLDLAAVDIRRHADESAQAMQFELSETIRELIDREYATSTNREVTLSTTLIDTQNQHERARLSQTEVASSFMVDRLRSLGTLNEFDVERIGSEVIDLFAQGLHTVEQFRTWLAGQIDPVTGEGPIAQSEVPIYVLAVHTMAEGLEKYEETYGSLANGQVEWVPPIQGPYRMSSLWGWRPDTTGDGRPEFHTGIDIQAEKGTTIVAVRGGTVRRYENRSAGFGVMVDHGDGTATRYAHLNGWAGVPANGSQVIAGQRIGQVGDSGNAKRPHLHFTYLVDGKPQDPIAAGVFVVGQ